MKRFEEISYRLHQDSHARGVKGKEEYEHAQTWLRSGTVDHWRHQRMYAYLDPVLESDQGARWLTVGDGRYGLDAFYLKQRGASAVASDISDALLKEAKEAGIIDEISRENAEALSFADDSFDYVLCKESFHHFPRPMIALYEMIRVARKGVFLLEPNEAPVFGSPVFILKRILKRIMIALGLSSRLRTPDTSVIMPYGNTYETVGNYVYAVSEREIEKVALGLNFPAVAFCGWNDWYVAGVEHEPCEERSPLLSRIKRQIERADRRMRRGLNLGTSINIGVCIFKQMPAEDLVHRLENAGYRVVKLPRNPYAGTSDGHGNPAP